MGLIPVFIYCVGLNSAIFTAWDSFHCSYTVLVLFQLYSLNGTHSSIRILFWSQIQLFSPYWDSFQYLYTVLVLNPVIFSVLGLNPVFVYCSGPNSAIFTEWDSFQYLYTVLVLIQLHPAIFSYFY